MVGGETIYYDRHADATLLRGKRVGIIGYGIQGRAQSLNLRDSGVDVLVANRKDRYAERAVKDGFAVHELDEVACLSDILFLLIPDQAQKSLYKTVISPTFRPGGLLVFAHGFALRYGEIVPDGRFNVGLLAPRMPGRQIRGYYKRGAGVPAFVDVVEDASGQTLALLLALGHAIGFTRAGMLRVDYRIETELDLFIEQYLVPTIIKAIRTGFDELVQRHGYPAVPALMELYASGEVGEVLMRAANVGIGRVFQENASPTCQFGISRSYADVLPGDQQTLIARTVDRIRNGAFADALEQDGQAGYPGVEELWRAVNSEALVRAQEQVASLFKLPVDSEEDG